MTEHAGAREDPVVEVQKGLHAEVLRYIIISLDNVMTLTVDDLADAGLQPLEINVPTPAAYIFHKGLVFQRRKNRNKKALVSEQRPPNTMPRLTDEQFRAYIYGTFRELIKRI